MITIVKILFPLFALYLVGVIAIFLIGTNSIKNKAFSTTRDFELDSQEVYNKTLSDYQEEEKFYVFRDPKVAYKILEQLKSPKDIPKNLPKGKDYPFYGIKSDDKYCDKNMKNFVEDPISLFEEMNLVMTSPPKSFIRKIVTPSIANDIHKEIGDHMGKTKREKSHINLKPEVNIFFTKNPMYGHKQIAQHFSCIGQESNHIPGHSTLDRKDSVAENAIKYAKNFENRTQCFNHDKFFPKTWLLFRKADCQEFFKILISQKYQEMKEEKRIVFIRKVAAGSHRGEGVQPVNDEEEKALLTDYANGMKCGKVTQIYIVQNYIHNPLLIDGHKFDFRMYMLIASTNPLMAFYHDGFLRVTLAKYDVNSNEKKVLLTNLALNKQIYDEVKGGNLYKGMDEEELKVAQQWSFDRLQDYLLEKGIITDPNWLDNYLRPEFKKAMIHLLRLSSYNFMKHSSLYELYGVDFMLDENLNLWFIEANSSPALHGYSIPMEKFIVKMLHDHFEVVMSLLRSRMKRVIDYVNVLTTKSLVVRNGRRRLVIKNIEAKREEFQRITKNYFEKEFEPGPSNGFSKIVDANYEGVEMYQGFISAECL